MKHKNNAGFFYFLFLTPTDGVSVALKTLLNLSLLLYCNVIVCPCSGSGLYWTLIHLLISSAI